MWPPHHHRVITTKAESLYIIQHISRDSMNNGHTRWSEKTNYLLFFHTETECRSVVHFDKPVKYDINLIYSRTQVDISKDDYNALLCQLLNSPANYRTRWAFEDEWEPMCWALNILLQSHAMEHHILLSWRLSKSCFISCVIKKALARKINERERESKIAESEKKSWTEGYIACNGPINNYRSVMPDTMSAYLFSDDYSVSMACLSTIKTIICTANVPQLKGIWVIPTRRIPITSELHTLRTWFWCRTELPCL